MHELELVGAIVHSAVLQDFQNGFFLKMSFLNFLILCDHSDRKWPQYLSSKMKLYFTIQLVGLTHHTFSKMFTKPYVY